MKNTECIPVTYVNGVSSLLTL